MYVRHLELQDLRAFRSAQIDLLYPGRKQDDGFSDISPWPPRLNNVNVMLGVNGSGKSTLLDAVALALLSPIIASSGYRPLSLIRRTNKGRPKQAMIGAELVLHAQDGAHPPKGQEERDRLETVVMQRGDIEFVSAPQKIGARWEGLFDDDGGGFFFVGYGATRRTEAASAGDLATRRRSRSVRYERVASLFEDHFALFPLNAWLPNWLSRDPDRFKEVVALLNKLLPKPVMFTGALENGEYLFKHGTIAVPFSALSDGYRTYVSWIGDLLYHLCIGTPNGMRLVDNRGVVMVDEIDLHIHPEWQRTIITSLAKTFRHIQFIFTTHSPLVVGTLERANIYNVQRGKGGLPEISRPEAETFGLSADQVLRSDVFGLNSTRDPAFREELDALSQAAGRGEEGAALQFMRKAALGGGAGETESSAPEWLKSFAAETQS